MFCNRQVNQCGLEAAEIIWDCPAQLMTDALIMEI
jgi:hypothetical protein